MRVSLDNNPATFAQQLASLRKRLTTEAETTHGQPQVSARMMLPTFLPYLTALRTELRDDIVPEQVMTAAVDLIANIALSTMQSIVEPPSPLVAGQIVEQMLMEAVKTACKSIAADAEKAAPKKPALKLVNGDGGDDNQGHDY